MSYGKKTAQKKSEGRDDSAAGKQSKGLKTLPSVPAVQRVEVEDEKQMGADLAEMEDEKQLKADPVQKVGGLEEELPAQGKFVAQLEELEEEKQLKKDPVQKVAEMEDEKQLKADPVQKVEEMEDEKQLKADPVQKKPNNTGMPNSLKAGVENMSGMDLSDVKVNYNSSKPAQLNALAYAQGNDIHVGAGQEKHLPHEAWHVVQQRQGRVKPTVQMKGGVPVNDDPALEMEADVMGARALQTKKSDSEGNSVPVQMKDSVVAQLVAPERRIEILNIVATKQEAVNKEKDTIYGMKKKDENKLRPGLGPNELSKLIGALDSSVATRQAIAALYVELGEPDPEGNAAKAGQEQSLKEAAVAEKALLGGG